MRIQLEDQEEPVEVDPEQVEVDDEDPFLTQDEVDGIVESRLNRERRKILRNVGLNPAEFRGEEGRINLDEVTDEEVFQRLADQKGIDLDEDGNPVAPEQEEEVQELRQKLSQYEQEKEDLQEKVSEYESTIEETRETKLETQVLTTADGVRDGAQEDIFVATRRRMKYDDEYGWVATDENGNPRFEGGEPVGAEGVIEELREEKPFYFRESSMEEGPDSTPTDEGGSNPESMEEMSMDERAKALNGGTSPVRSSDDDRVQRLNRDPGRSW